MARVQANMVVVQVPHELRIALQELNKKTVPVQQNTRNAPLRIVFSRTLQQGKQAVIGHRHGG